MVRTHASSANAQPAPMHTLPTKQRVMLELILQYHHVTGEACSPMQLARRLSLHHSTVQEQLQALYQKGWLNTASGPVIPRVF
jgi:Mn-dependent DtxR family transcriptional regulator